MLRTFLMVSPPDGTGAARLAVLHEIALALSGELDRRRLYEGIVQGAKKLLGVPRAAVLSWDAGREELVTEAATGDHPRVTATPSELGACEGRAFTSRRTAICDDYGNSPRAPSHARGIAAAVATPLLRETTPLGVLFAAHTDPAERFTPDDIRLLEVLAGHVSLALANAEVVAGAARRLARAEELANVLRGVAEARDRDAIAQRTLDCATTVLGADRAALYLVDADGEITFVAARRLSRPYLEFVAQYYKRSVGGLLPLTRAPLFVADMSTDPRTRVMHEMAAHEGIRSMMIVPLINRADVYGAVALYHDGVYRYDQHEVAQLRALADQVALALGGAALHAQTTRQLAQLRALDAVQRAVADPGNEVERCQRAAHAIVAGGGATRAWVFHARGHELDLVASSGATALSDDPARAAARTALAGGRVVSQAPAGTDPVVAAPITHQGRTYGALVLASPRPLSPEPGRGTVVLTYAEDHELPLARHEVASTAAGQLAVAIANARLYDEARTMGVRLAAVIAGMPDGILVFDRHDRVVFYNRKVQEAYGLEDVDLTGWSPMDFLREVTHCYVDPGVPREIARRIADEKDRVHRIEFELRHPRRMIIERISGPVTTPDGESFGQVVVYHDLTELRDAERAREEALGRADTQRFERI